MKNPMAQVYKSSFFETRLTFRLFGVKATRYSETKKRKCATSIMVESVGVLVGCSSPFIQLSEHLGALLAWWEQNVRLVGENLKCFVPCIGGVRGSTVVRLRPCTTSSTPPAPFPTHPLHPTSLTVLPKALVERVPGLGARELRGFPSSRTT